MNDLTHLSLFSGIGGLDLAAEWAGFRTVGQCEWADYPRKVLEKHWPGLPRWRDIRTLTKESFYEQTGLESVTVLSGGFPCQPFSTAGKRRGKEDDRYLWPEMLRVIQEIRPRWAVGENVAGIVTLALDTVLSDLESIGYTCQAVIIPACAVDAPHRRDRCAIVAHAHNPQTARQREHSRAIHTEPAAEGSRLRSNDVAYAGSIGLQAQGPEQQTTRTAGSSEDVPNTNGTMQSITVHPWERGAGLINLRESDPNTNDGCGAMWRECQLPAIERDGGCGIHFGRREKEYGCGEWWPVEPNVGRVAHGIPFRVDRLKCLGNAVVPQQFYPIFQAIAEIESSTQQCCGSLGG